MERTPLGFAHRGASAHAPDNTLRAFGLALEMGAPGLESDVWLTADGVPVLHHGRTTRGRALATLQADAVPQRIPRLADLFARCGTDFDLSLDLKDTRSAAAVIETAQRAGHDPRRLWLCGRGPEPLVWRDLDARVRLVCDTRSAHLTAGWPSYLAVVRDGGADAISLRRRRWSAELVEVVHRAALLAFGWDAQSDRRLRRLLELGCDAVYSDHVDRMVHAIAMTSARPG